MTSNDKDSRLPSGQVNPALMERLSAGNPRYGLTAMGLCALTWFLLTGSDWKSWLVGLPVVVLATWSILWLRGPAEDRLNLIGLMRFLPYFIRESIFGGIDVASRVMRPKMHIAPGFLEYPMGLTHPPARRLFLNSLSLLPGTLAADLDGDVLCIHALDRCVDLKDELDRLERMVSAVYGEQL